MKKKITNVVQLTDGYGIIYEDGTKEVISKNNFNPSVYKIGATIDSKPNSGKPNSGGRSNTSNDYYNVKDYGLKDELAKKGYISIEPGQAYAWSDEAVGAQHPSNSKWTWDEESGFIRPSGVEYGAGALEDYKRRHGEKIEADYPGGWDKWVTDLKADKTNNNVAVKWLVGEVNKKSQELTGQDYVDVSKKSAYVPGVEIFNLPGIWTETPKEETFPDDSCPEGYEKNVNGECVPVQVEETCSEGCVKNPITGECEPVKEPFKDTYAEKDKPWLPDRLNVLGAMSDRIYVGEPQLEQINLEPGDIALQTPDRALAASKESQNKLIDFIQGSQPMQQGVAAAIGATSQGLEQQANIIAQVEGANTDRINQYSQYAAGIQNQEEQYNKAALKRFVDERNQLNQNLSDERDMKDANVLSATNRMLGNWYKKKWSEKVLFPQAYVDPDSGDPYWTGKGRDITSPYDTYTTAYGNLSGGRMSADEMAMKIQELVDGGMDQGNATKLVLSQNQPMRTGRGGNSSYDPYDNTDFSEGRKTKSKSGGSIPFGVFLQGGIFE